MQSSDKGTSKAWLQLAFYGMYNLPKNSFLVSNMEKTEILFNWIKDTYGTQEELAKVLDLGIEMLFYLEEDTFDKRELQQVVTALRGITKGLRLNSPQ